MNSTQPNTADAAAPSAPCTSRFTSPESDKREQQESDCIEVDGEPMDFDECDPSSPAWVWQQSPPPIEQWLSPFALAGRIRHPDRQFNPPHHNKMRMEI